MSQKHPLGPELEVFSGQENTKTPEELRAVATYFEQITDNALLGNIEHIKHTQVAVHTIDSEQGYYDTLPPETEDSFYNSSFTKSQLTLRRFSTPDDSLDLNGGRFEIGIQKIEPDETEYVPNESRVFVGIIYYNANNQREQKVFYTLYPDDVVRREDAVESETELDRLEAKQNFAAINNGDQEAMEREAKRQSDLHAMHAANRALEDQMLVNRQPIGFEEVQWLESVLRHAVPAQ